MHSLINMSEEEQTSRIRKWKILDHSGSYMNYSVSNCQGKRFRAENGVLNPNQQVGYCILIR